MKRSSLLMLVLAAFAFACASDDQKPSPQSQPGFTDKTTGYGTQPRSEPVGVIPVATLHDAQRSKNLDIAIEYPTRGGPYPLIILSHELGSSSQGYEQLVSYWTSYGYVCIRPNHADAGQGRDAMQQIFSNAPQSGRNGRGERRRPSEQETAKARETRAEAERREIAKIWETQHEPQWRDRARDISLIIDQLDTLEQQFPELKGKIDHGKIGVAGHSLGAFTAMLIGGVKTFGNPPVAAGDSRVKAIVAMSPQGVTASLGLNPQSFADLRVPALFLTGTEDLGAAANEDWQWRKTAYTNAPAGDKYFALLKGGRHSTFAGTFTPVDIPQTTSIPPPMTPSPYPPGDPRNPNQIYENVQAPVGPVNPQVGRGLFNDVRLLSVAFWDAYLKGNAKGREFLDTTAASLGGVTLEKK